ncbi:hypothetical protein M378DRAFT_678122 [Amanita muscaria Koide BX008]|uniref:Cytoplasmic protein n=1 Tax=Amanita muscaria (strain Koide BX008) TaxID=946122 RepID=A0A0C2XKE3_AMAMK|nr:hypothetical protein M378DRAFT_678122 [Amanita muscaria Koide BX008]
MLANEARPKSDATITIRVIKSFQFRTTRSLVMHHVNLEIITVGQLKENIRQVIQSQQAWKAYRNVQLDTIKLYTKAHSAKTTNLIINLDHDDWILNEDNKVLADVGFEHETEVSIFNRAHYEAFKQDPKTGWD